MLQCSFERRRIGFVRCRTGPMADRRGQHRCSSEVLREVDDRKCGVEHLARRRDHGDAYGVGKRPRVPLGRFDGGYMGIE